jgi:hypothetical protein
MRQTTRTAVWDTKLQAAPPPQINCSAQKQWISYMNNNQLDVGTVYRQFIE